MLRQPCPEGRPTRALTYLPAREWELLSLTSSDGFAWLRLDQRLPWTNRSSGQTRCGVWRILVAVGVASKRMGQGKG